MADIIAEGFASRTPFKNYMYLLYQILFQMKTDKSFFEHHGNFVKDEIRYYINEMKSDISYHRFLLNIHWLLAILDKKLFNQDYGFGGEEDYKVFVKVNDWILDEIGYRNATCQCYSYGRSMSYLCSQRRGIDCDCQVYFRCCEYVHPFEDNPF